MMGNLNILWPQEVLQSYFSLFLTAALGEQYSSSAWSGLEEKFFSQMSHFTVEIWEEWGILHWLPLNCGWRKEKNVPDAFRELWAVNKAVQP